MIHSLSLFDPSTAETTKSIRHVAAIKPPMFLINVPALRSGRDHYTFTAAISPIKPQALPLYFSSYQIPHRNEERKIRAKKKKTQ